MFQKLFASTPHNQGITRTPQKARRRVLPDPLESA